ncbi:MAG: hypothetical protein IPF42_14705 [Candidatus Microthrix sp.]|nr:hypothetical protein [Candidatus Microthrix sp.]
MPSAPERQEPEPSTAEPTRRNERPVGPSTEPAEPAEPRTPPTSSPPATAETPAASGSTGAAPAVSGLARAAPAPAKRGRRAVIDPATGQPINPESKPKPGGDPVGSAHSNGGQSRPPGPEADVPDAGSSAELSVRLIAPGLTREEPEVIDLRDQRRVPPAADIVPPASRQGEELIDIVGIGPKIADQLRQAGVVTLADLAGLDLDGPLPTSIEGLRGRLRQGDWVGQARRLTD